MASSSRAESVKSAAAVAAVSLVLTTMHVEENFRAQTSFERFLFDATIIKFLGLSL